MAHSTHKPTRGLALGVVGSGTLELCHQPLGLTPPSRHTLLSHGVT